MLKRYRLMTATGLVVAMLLGACSGGGDAKEEKSETKPAAAGGANTVTATLTEFAIQPSPASVSAGEVTFTVKNSGAVPHELAIVKSDADPKKLPQKDGLADESVNKPLGRTKEIATGASGTVTAKLEPGKYVLLCNLAGHYSAAMATSFTVK